MDWVWPSRLVIFVMAQEPSPVPSPVPSPEAGTGGLGDGWLDNLISLLGDLFNAIFKLIIDGLAAVLPSTPEAVKIGSLLSGFIAENSVSSNFEYFLLQIFQGLAGIVLMVALYKLIKLLPLT